MALNFLAICYWFIDVKKINDNLKSFIDKEGFKIDFENCINNKQIEDFVLNDRIEGTKKFKAEIFSYGTNINAEKVKSIAG